MLRILLILFGITAVVVGGLGFRGQTSSNRPWHVFLDMKYQARYGAQGQSEYFADGRAMRMPVEGTIPYDGGVTRNDAGDHGDPNPNFLPDADPAVQPLLYAIPVQLLAYYTAVAKGTDVDMPRNLAKSVTVE